MNPRPSVTLDATRNPMAMLKIKPLSSRSRSIRNPLEVKAYTSRSQRDIEQLVSPDAPLSRNVAQKSLNSKPKTHNDYP